MLLDTFFQPYKLVGTALVPLNNLINEIYDETSEQIEKENKKVQLAPCMRVTHGVFDIKNLMGAEIGHISCIVRLTCFGSSLLPHIQEVIAQNSLKVANKKQPAGNDAKRRSSSTGSATNQETRRSIELVKQSDNETTRKASAMIQTIQIDYTDAQVQIDSPSATKSDKTTQSPTRKQSSESRIKHVVQDEFAFNHYCPPPLAYNSTNDQKDECKLPESLTTTHRIQTIKMTSVNKKIFINKRIEYLNEAIQNETNDLTEEADENETTIREVTEDYEQQTEAFIVKPRKQQGFSFDDMPLLKCLFEEMSKLKGMVESNPNSKALKKPSIMKSKSKSKSPLRKQTKKEIDVKIYEPPKKEEKKKRKPKSGPNQAPKSILKLNKNPFKSRDELLKSVNRLAQPKYIKESKNSLVDDEAETAPISARSDSSKSTRSPRLKYGLTHTHKMRVLASHAKKHDVDAKHESLVKEVKSNLDSLSLNASMNANQSIGQKDQENLQRNLEKVLFSDSFNSTNVNATLLSTVNNNNKPGNGSLVMKSVQPGSINYSLLNKVDLESTAFDTQNNANRQSNEFSELTSSDQQQLVVKAVKFGDTYVLNTSNQDPTPSFTSPSSVSKEEPPKQQQTPPVKKERTKNIDYSLSQSTELRSSNSTTLDPNQNVFLDATGRKSEYEYDFNSSLDTSTMSSRKSTSTTTTTSNFFTTRMDQQRRQSPSQRRHPRIKEESEIDSHSAEKEDEESSSFGGQIRFRQRRLRSNDDEQVRTSSKLSGDSYNMRSFIDESTPRDSSAQSSMR